MRREDRDGTRAEAAPAATAGGKQDTPRPRLDLRLLPPAMSCWAAAAWAVAAPPRWALAAAAVFGAASIALLVAAAVGRRQATGARGGREPRSTTRALPAARRAPPAMALACAACAVLLLSAGVQHGLRAPPALRELVEGDRSAVAVLRIDSADAAPAAAPGRGGEGRFLVEAHLREAATGVSRLTLDAPITVYADGDWSRLRLGQLVRARLKLSPNRPGEPSAAFAVPVGPPVVIGQPPRYLAWTERLRSGLREAASALPADSRGLLPGIVVGDTTGLPADLGEAMKETGMTHLTAVSGANLVLAGGAALFCAALLGLRRWIQLAAAGAAVAAFVVLVRPEPSVLRAAVMAWAGLVGLASGRNGRGLPSLLLAMIVLLIADPWLGRDFAFALSVLATLGLVLCAAPWARALGRVLPRPVSLAIAVPAAAQAFCAPVIILLQPRFLLYAVPANMLAAPAVAPATLLGLLAVPLAQVSLPAARFLLWWAGWSTQWIAGVARFFAAAPAATLPWVAGWPGLLLLASVTALAAVGAFRLTRLNRRRALAATSMLAVLVVAALAVTELRGRSWLPETWAAVVCDVGQGSAAVVRSGGHSAMVFDVGEEAGPIDACLDLLGVRSIFLVLSHFDLDHVGGLEGAMRGRILQAAVVGPVDLPAPNAARVRALLAGAGVPETRLAAGARGSFGTAAWQVLWPEPGGAPADPAAPRAPGGDGAESSNDSSVVMSVTVDGVTIVFPGDIGPEAQRGILRAGDPTADVLVVPHHGSRDQDPRFFRDLSPALAVTSSGKDNDYGHPAPETLDVLRGLGATIRRTDECGDVAIAVDPGLTVATQRPCG